MDVTFQTLIDKLKQDIICIESQSIRVQVSEFIDVFYEMMMKAQVDHPLPEMLVIREPDEFYLEWMFDNCRLGFDFLEDSDYSGWFILIRREEDMYRSRSKFNRDYHKAVDFVIAMIVGLRYDCNRLFVKYNQLVLTILELEIVLGERTWDRYVFDQIRP